MARWWDRTMLSPSKLEPSARHGASGWASAHPDWQWSHAN